MFTFFTQLEVVALFCAALCAAAFICSALVQEPYHSSTRAGGFAFMLLAAFALAVDFPSTNLLLNLLQFVMFSSIAVVAYIRMEVARHLATPAVYPTERKN